MLFELDPDFPVASVTRDGTKVLLTLDAPNPEWARSISDGLRVLESVGRLLRRSVEAAARQDRTAAVITAQHRQEERIRQAYEQRRSAGLGHYAAVRTVAEDPTFEALRSQGWSHPDFARVIRANAPEKSLVGQWVPIKVAARHFACTPRTVSQWIASHVMVSRRTPSGRRLVQIT